LSPKDGDHLRHRKPSPAVEDLSEKEGHPMRVAPVALLLEGKVHIRLREEALLQCDLSEERTLIAGRGIHRRLLPRGTVSTRDPSLRAWEKR